MKTFLTFIYVLLHYRVQFMYPAQGMQVAVATGGCIFRADIGMAVYKLGSKVRQYGFPLVQTTGKQVLSGVLVYSGLHPGQQIIGSGKAGESCLALFQIRPRKSGDLAVAAYRVQR